MERIELNTSAGQTIKAYIVNSVSQIPKKASYENYIYDTDNNCYIMYFIWTNKGIRRYIVPVVKPSY